MYFLCKRHEKWIIGAINSKIARKMDVILRFKEPWRRRRSREKHFVWYLNKWIASAKSTWCMRWWQRLEREKISWQYFRRQRSGKKAFHLTSTTLRWWRKLANDWIQLTQHWSLAGVGVDEKRKERKEKTSPAAINLTHKFSFHVILTSSSIP